MSDTNHKECGSGLSVATAVEQNAPHSHRLRLHRAKQRPDTFFLTKCIQPRKPALTPDLREVVCASFRHAVQTERILLRAFVVMPDHWHGLFALRGDWTLPRFMHSFMSFVGGRTAGALAARGCTWQDGYYDTRIHSTKQFHYVADYIVQNPVRRGFVTNTEEWDATSLCVQVLVTDPWPWLFEQDLGGAGH